MKKLNLCLQTAFLCAVSLHVAAQEDALEFFSRVPEMTKNYSSPGNPCGNSIEFFVNKNDEKNPVQLKASNISKDSKGKAQVKIGEGGNQTVWYKLTFNTDCYLSFRIYSDVINDVYHFLVYKDDGSPDFCNRLSQKKVVPLRANLLEHKEGIIGTGISDGIKINYKDSSDFYFKRILLHTPFLDGIKAKAGETYYVNIYHMEGTDKYHYLVLSACYKEVNLLTQNENITGERSKIIDQLPEHVTKPPAEKTEKDSVSAAEKIAVEKKKAEAEKKKTDEKTKSEAKKKEQKEKEDKAKAEAAEKKIAEAKAKHEKKKEEAKKPEEEKKKAETKKTSTKLNPQLVKFDEKDTLNQYLVEGEIIYTKDPIGPVVDAEIYIANSDGSVTVLKKMYTNEKGAFRFANLPSEHNYELTVNVNDVKMNIEKEPEVSGKITLKGEPVKDVPINSSVRTAEDGSFKLTSKNLTIINLSELFADRKNGWLDMSDPFVYSEIMKKYGDFALEGLAFRVQIGAYRDEENFNYSSLQELAKVEIINPADSITRFIMGNFNTIKEADDFRKKILQKGVKDAFVVGFFSGERQLLEALIRKKIMEK